MEYTSKDEYAPFKGALIECECLKEARRHLYNIRDIICKGALIQHMWYYLKALVGYLKVI